MEAEHFIGVSSVEVLRTVVISDFVFLDSNSQSILLYVGDGAVEL